MDKQDIAQVNEIDREVFPTQWPPANYRHELQNQLAHYIVACDENETVEETGVRERPEQGPYATATRIRQWFGRFFGNKKPPSGGKLITGFAGIWVLADEAHITNIAVRKRYQRRGIGELLLISIIDMAEKLKADIMTLEVRASNTAAQDLYYKYNFKQVGVRRAYYTDNREDGVLMSTESIKSPSFQGHLQQLKQAYSTRWGIESSQLTINRRALPGR